MSDTKPEEESLWVRNGSTIYAVFCKANGERRPLPRAGARAHHLASIPQTKFVIGSRQMGIEVTKIEVAERRWVESTHRAAVEILMHGSTAQKLGWALAVYDGRVTKASRGPGQGVRLSLPAHLRMAMGIVPGDLVVWKPTDHGTVELRAATEQDMPGFETLLAEPGYVQKGPAQLPRRVKLFDKTCEGCAKALHGVGNRRRFCADCRRDRYRAQAREYWHERGKQTPSYRAKLKRHVRTESPAELVLA